MVEGSVCEGCGTDAPSTRRRLDKIITVKSWPEEPFTVFICDPCDLLREKILEMQK